ncbi:MAG: hypothetical protein EHJ95_04865 [Methanobacteriota archaeon]|nr:MAG: hypothetical protein EHJ95_04865 [Euryarchaeota archaeon]
MKEVIDMLQLTNCKKCGKMYMVGFRGFDTRGTKFSGGKIGDTPYIAFGDEEVEDAPSITVGEVVPCPGCGEMCEVEEAKPVDK